MRLDRHVAGQQTRPMIDTITLTGIIATDPRTVTTEAGLDIASFRLASTIRRYDRATDTWSDGETNWYTVTAFRAIAGNVAASVKKGDRVLVTGRLRVRPWQNGERSGTTVEIDADALGHDLRWGRSTFTRSSASVSAASNGDDVPAAAVGGSADGSGDAVPTESDAEEARVGSSSPADPVGWSTAPLGPDESSAPPGGAAGPASRDLVGIETPF